MKRGALPLNALRAFEATARLGTMNQAALELGVTYSAISRQVRGLERLLDVSLFEGPRNRLVLSETALQLAPGLTRALDSIEEAVNRVTRRDRRALDVSCLATLTMRWLIPRLYDFHARHPDIEVRLTSDHRPVDFSHRRTDVAIRIVSVAGNDWDGINVVSLFDERVGPVLSPSLLPNTGLNELKALGELPILHSQTRPTAWADWCRETGTSFPVAGKNYEHYYFLLEAAASGLGAAIAPEVLVRDDLSANRLIAPFGFVASGLTYVALSGQLPSRDARTFISWLREQT